MSDPGDETTTHRLRVRYCETDQMGLAHHGSYIAWFEEARTEWLRERGKTYRAWEEEGVFLQVVTVKVQYLRPTRYDDEIEIHTRLCSRQAASITLAYELYRVGDRARVAVAETKLACVDGRGRISRLPAGI